jgi:hypothetical protein
MGEVEAQPPGQGVDQSRLAPIVGDELQLGALLSQVPAKQVAQPGARRRRTRSVPLQAKTSGAGALVGREAPSHDVELGGVQVQRRLPDMDLILLGRCQRHRDPAA